MKSTSQIIAENPRMAWAILGSMLLHASLVSVFSLGLHRPPPPRPVELTGFAASLVARIVGAKEKETRSAPGRASKPDAAPRETMVVERPAPAFIAPAYESSDADNEAIAFSADAGEGEGDADGYRGVSVTETLFHRSGPPDFRKRLGELPGYFVLTQLNRRPEPVNIVLPRYPAKELAARTYTWIIVALFIDENGRVVAAVPVDGGEGYEDFQEQVAAALQESTFKSAERFGLPVKSMIFQMVEFRPPDPLVDVSPSSAPPTVAP